VQMSNQPVVQLREGSLHTNFWLSVVSCPSGESNWLLTEDKKLSGKYAS
jgi:hypothetical protein